MTSRRRATSAAPSSRLHPGEGDGELLTAVAGEDVARAQHVAPGRGDALQQAVPRLVAVLVVVELEVVEVDQRHAERGLVAARACELADHRLLPGPAVGEPGQLVRSGHQLEALHELRPLLGERLEPVGEPAFTTREDVEHQAADRDCGHPHHPVGNAARHPARRQRPRVAGTNPRDVEQGRPAREEERYVEADPDIEERVEAARVGAVVDGPGDDERSERHGDVQRADAEPAPERRP